MKWNDDKVKELKKLLKDNKTYKDIGEYFNITPHSVKCKIRKMNLIYNKPVKTEDKFVCLTCNEEFFDKYDRKFCSKSCSTIYNNRKRKIIKFCLNCNVELSRSNRKFCSNKCQNDYEYSTFITKWKNGELSGTRGNYGTSSNIRRYLFEKYDNKCSKCGWGVINEYTGKIPLEIEHIDGNSENNKEENLTLLCPSCHSLTKTYKGANRGNGRHNRRKRYLENKSY